MTGAEWLAGMSVGTRRAAAAGICRAICRARFI